MRRILLFGRTYFQLISFIQLKLTLFKNDHVVLLFTDDSIDSDIYFKNIVTNKIFDEAYFIRKNNTDKYNKIDYIIKILFSKKNSKHHYLNLMNERYFDEFICWNLDFDLLCLSTILFKNNNNIKLSLIEESILCYNDFPNLNSDFIFLNHVLNFFRIRNYVFNMHLFYCYNPELVVWTKSTMKIPDLNNNNLKTCLSKVFNVNDSNEFSKYKYIYFTSSSDNSEAYFEETKIVNQIARLVGGKDNILIKLHPRDFNNYYIENGYCVDKFSSIPWDVSVLLNDFRNPVFFSTFSSCLFISEHLINNFSAYYLYELFTIKNNFIYVASKKNIEQLINRCNKYHMFKNIHIVNSIQDINL